MPVTKLNFGYGVSGSRTKVWWLGSPGEVGWLQRQIARRLWKLNQLSLLWWSNNRNKGNRPSTKQAVHCDGKVGDISPPWPSPPLPVAYIWRSLSICSRACFDCWRPFSLSLPSWPPGWSQSESQAVLGFHQNLGWSPFRSQKTSSASHTPAS